MTNIIIFEIEDGHPSGVVRYIQMLSKGMMNSLDIRIHRICLDSHLVFPLIRKVNNCVISKIPFPSPSTPLRKELYWQTKYFNVVAKLLIPHLKGMQNIVWDINELFMCNLANILKSELGGVIIFKLHTIPWKFSMEYDERRFNQLYADFLKNDYNSIKLNQLEQIAYTSADHIICVSSSAKQHIISAFNIEPSKISVVFNGLSNDIVTTLPYCKRNTEEHFDILFAGRISKEKGTIGLLNALKKVKEQGYHYNLKLAGYYTNSMKQKIYTSYKGLEVELLGKISFNELIHLYSTCTIGVIPSLHEQCSYVAIEMSMFGIPMIVSDVDALSEMFEDEINALKVPLVFDEDFGIGLDEDKLAVNIIRLMENKELRYLISENAVENYKAKFKLEQMVEQTLDIYRKLT